MSAKILQFPANRLEWRASVLASKILDLQQERVAWAKARWPNEPMAAIDALWASDDWLIKEYGE